MTRTLSSCLLTLLLLQAPAPASAGTEPEKGSLLIPVYDRFEDVGALLTPTEKVDLSRSEATLHAELFFSVLHHGKQLSGTTVSRVLLNLSANQPFLGRQERTCLFAMADDQRMLFEDVELVGLEGAALPIRQLRVWIPVQDLARLAHATSADFRVGLYEFSLSEEMKGYLADLCRQVGWSGR